MRPDRNNDREWGELPAKRGNKTLVIVAVVGVLIAVIGLALWFFLGRGETTAEVIEKHRPKFADMRAKLKRIGEKLPPPGTVAGDTLPANLNPKPVYDVPGKTFNTAIIMAAHCADPDAEPKSPTEMNVGFHEDEFLTHLGWTGNKSKLVESAQRSRAGDLAQRFDRSLTLPYLVVARPVRFDPPRAVNDQTFIGGDLDLEVFLIDLPGEKVLGSFRRSFRPDANVMVTFRNDRKESESAEAFVYSNVWSKARTELAAILARATGGTFAIERR